MNLKTYIVIFKLNNGYKYDMLGTIKITFYVFPRKQNALGILFSFHANINGLSSYKSSLKLKFT